MNCSKIEKKVGKDKKRRVIIKFMEGARTEGKRREDPMMGEIQTFHFEKKEPRQQRNQINKKVS